MSKLLKNVIALFLIIILIGANLLILGENYAVYAADVDELNKQDSKTNNKNVEFNSYFYGESHTQTFDMSKDDAKIFVKVKVNNAGFVENGIVEFQNANFKLKEGTKSKYIKNIDSTNNKVTLNKIENGTEAIIELPIEILKDENVSQDFFKKETNTKFTGTYVDSEGNDKSVQKEVTNIVIWKGTAEAELSLELTKYIPYVVDGNYGVMVQTKINSKVKDNVLPIGTTNIEVVVPTINNVKPTSANVIATKTEATNGEGNGLNLNSQNYSYNSENGKLTINTSNLQNTISWKQNVVDEYLATYIFEGKEIYDHVTLNGIDTSVIANSKLSLYNGEETNVEKSSKLDIKYNHSIGEFTNFEMQATTEMSKGHIYANYEAKSKVETEYAIKYMAVIDNINLVKEIKFSQGIDSFVTTDKKEGPTTLNNNNYAYNKRIEVSKAIFDKILGQDGTILIKDGNTELGKINKETTLENGNYVLDISSKNNNKLEIITTAPIAEGILEINVVKALKGDIAYSQKQMQEFKSLKVTSESSTNVFNKNINASINLKEPETKVELAVSKKDLTTVVKNENVELRAVLDTSNDYNALFKNPTLKFTLPSEIKQVKVKSTNILLNNGLKIKETKTTEENGHKVINVTLEGTQTDYTINAEYKGTIIVLNTDLTVETLTPTGSSKITLEYNNENKTAEKAKGKIEQEIKFVAPSGVVAASGVSNYKQNAPELLSISSEEQTAEIDTYTEKRQAKMEGTIINNYSNDISNVKVLGRIPSQGNKKIDTDSDLGSTFTTPLSTAVATSGVNSNEYKVYYSDNQNATNDLEDENNNWSETATTNSKSYLIDFNDDYKIKSGDKVEFSYNVEIPESLSANNDTYGMYKVYYDNNSNIGTMAENKVSAVMGMSTGEGPELEVNLSSTADTIREGQYIKMRATIKNVGDVDAEGVKINAKAPEYVTFLDYGLGNGFYELEEDTYTIDVGTVKKGDTVEKSYYIKIDDNTARVDPSLKDEMTDEEYYKYMEEKMKFPKEVINTVNVTLNEISGEIQSNEVKFEVQDGDIKINTFSYTGEDEVLKNGDTIRYGINLRDISTTGKDLTNTVVTIKLPDGIKFEKAVIKNTVSASEETSDGVSYNESVNTVTINVGTLDLMKYIELTVRVDGLEGDFSIMPVVTADNVEEHYSNIFEHKSGKVELEISELTSSPRYVKESQNVTYKFSIKNVGQTTVRNLLIVDELPTDLSYIYTKYNYNGEERKDSTLTDGKIQVKLNVLQPGETTQVEIVAKAGLLPDENDKEVQNKVTISAQSFEAVDTNTVSNIIEYYEDAHNGSSGGGNATNRRHKITGTAWLDENLDGKKDSGETRLPNIQVMLLNKNGNSIVKDPNTNEEKITTTSSNGTYEFSNIPNGDYLVVFLYDSSNYSLTEYQKSGVDEGFNSDAIDINLTLNGERRIAGITDVITINGDNARDIDIGLYTANKFDLRLDKYISKVSLTTPTIGTRVDNFNNSELVKEEVLGQNLGKSSAVVEYKIVVTNEGSVAGYVNKIVDYLPKKVDFNTELNTDWYLSENGNIYNSSLANEKINPGESKEVTLIVSVQITEDNLGTLENYAEIYEAYNEQGLQDIDSVPANNEDAEDDMGKAELILSLVTGKIVAYTSITLAVIAILGIGIYEIKKRVLNKKI